MNGLGISGEHSLELSRHDRGALTNEYLQVASAADERQPRLTPALDDQPAHSVEKPAQALEPALRRIRRCAEHGRLAQVLAAHLLHDAALVHREREVRRLREPQLPEQLGAAPCGTALADGELDELRLRGERAGAAERERAERAVLRSWRGHRRGRAQARVHLERDDESQPAKVLVAAAERTQSKAAVRKRT
jgi:hypothetical protein